jgi:hypothetical protein
MLRKSIFALGALTTVATAALSTSASAAWGHGSFGRHYGGLNHLGYRGWNWGYRYYEHYSPSYGSYWYSSPVYSAPAAPVYSAPTAPVYSAPTPTIAVNQKVYVEGNNNGVPPLAAPDGPPPPR